MAYVDTQRTKAELISVEQELAKKEGDNEKNEAKEPVMSSKDLGAVGRNSERSEIAFENHVNGVSSSNPEEDAKNDAVSSGEAEQSKNNVVEVTNSEGDLVKNIVVKSVEWVQNESDVVYIRKAGQDSKSVQQENGREENPETALENHIHDTRVTDAEDDKSKRMSEDNENNNVNSDIKDDMKNDDSSSRENELVENYDEKDFNDDSIELTLEHGSKIEHIPELTFESILVEDSTTLNSQVVIEDIFNSRQIKIQDDPKDDDVGSKEWVQIESNLTYMGKEDDALETQEQHDNEMEGTVEMATKRNDHDIGPLNSQTIESNSDSKKREDPEIHIHEDLKHDLNSRERAEIVLTDIDIHDVLRKDDLSPRECAKVENKSAGGNNEQTVNSDGLTLTEGKVIESNLVDFGEDTDNEFVSMQLQHEKEMQELRTNLQDEYQNQVLKISDELREHYQNDMDEKVAKLEEDWELEFTRQKREYDGQVSAVQREQWTQCQEAIERVTLDAEDQLKNMKYCYERETAEHKQRIKELLEREALWEMKEKELTNEKSHKENESMSKIKKLENQLSFEREEIEAQLTSAQDEIKALRKQHEIETKNLTNELDKKYSDILDEMRKELKSKYQDEMDHKVSQVECHLREQYEQDLEKTKEEIQQTTSTLKTKYEKQVAETLLQLEELHERNQEHELREAKLKEKFKSKKAKVAELLSEVEQKTKIVEELEQNKKDLKTLEEKFKLCLSEKCILEEKVKGNSESTAEETVGLQEELARKSNVIHDIEVNDSESKLKDLEEKLKNLTLEKDSTEKKLSEDLKSEKLNVEGLRNELEMKEKEIERLRQKDLEDKIRTKILEDKPLDEAVEQTAGSQNNEITSSQQDLPNEMQEFKDEVKEDKMKDKCEELEAKLHEITLEKQSLQQQLVESKSEITSLQEMLKENENIASQLKSNCDTKILQMTRNFEEEMNALENELKLKKNCEEEISKLNEELQKHKATISELEETSRGREIEIANLILNSPSPHGLSDQEFDFSVNSGDRTQQLENELSKYKKKVQELEEEAEDKFEASLCPNCQDREKSEEILIQTKALVDKIKLDCEKKVQSVSTDLEKTENSLREQIAASRDLKAKLEKAEEDLSEERKRSLEISNIGKHFDVNRNVLGHEENSKDTLGTEVDKTKDEFYKNEISRKDKEISRLMTENTKNQEQIQNVNEKFNEGAAQYEQLKIRTLEQKTKYENEINLMQKEIEILIQQNKEVKEQLKMLQTIQNEAVEIRRKLKESEEVFQDKCQETEDLNAKLQEAENILKQDSSKYEQEIVILKETVLEKENCMSNLRNSLDLLEKTREGLEMDLSNQKQEFSKRERSLLHEISEMTIDFENEKAKILEDSFLDKEEMKQKVHGLEMLNHEYNFHTAEDDIRGYERVDGDSSPEEYTGDGDTFGYEQVPLDNSHKTRSTREHEWVNVDRKATRGTGKEMVPACSEKVKYEEINYYPSENFEHTDEMHSDDDNEVLKIGKETERRIQKSGKHKQELSVLSDLKREVMKDEYALFDDNEFDNPFLEGSPESLFSDRKYKEIGCEENLELLKYKHDIDLLLARKENERLRAEIGTLTNCVDVFHDECDSLKRSLDKTLNMVGMLRHERDDLMKKHDSNMADHSELVFDLIKYEETIHRLERGNEKLEEDKKLLEECLMGKQSVPFHESPIENQARLSNDAKTESYFALQDDRRGEYDTKLLEECLVGKRTMLFEESPTEKQGKFLHNKSGYPMQDEKRKLLQDRRVENRASFPNSPAAERSLQLGSEVATFLPDDNPILRTKSEYEISETDFQRKGQKYKKDDVNVLGKHEVLERKESLMLEDLVKEAEVERKLMDDLLPCRTEDMKMDTVNGIKMQFATDSKRFHKEGAFAVDVARSLPSMGCTRDVKTQIQDGNRRLIGQDINKLTTESMLNHSKRSYKESAISPQHAQTEGNRPFSNYRYKAQTSEFNISTTQPYTKEMKSLRGNKMPSKTTIKSYPHLVVTERLGLPQENASAKQSSKFKNSSIEFPRNDKVPYNSHNSVEVVRNVTPSSRFTRRTGRNGITERGKSLKSNSKRMPGNTPTANSSNYSSSSILTSTRANLTTRDRLVPNLSGLSPIVSPLDRHYHAEKLRWQIVEDERSNTSRPNHDNTTFLLNIDPNELLQTPTTTNRESFVSRRTRTHNRSRSADDRLLTREMSLSHELYQEKPLLINFEDFICRHRVKSSEDVANIRDPSPAELWFS